MKRLVALFSLLVALAGTSWAAYTYYVSIPNMASFNWSQWTLNGSLAVVNTGSYYALESTYPSTSSYGAIISNVAVPDGSSDYEVKVKGDGARILLRASTNANADGSVGSAYQVIATSGYVQIVKKVSGSSTSLAFAWIYSTPPPVSTYRAVVSGNQIIVYVNGALIVQTTDSSLTSGQAGLAILDNYGTVQITELYVGPLDRTAPNPINTSSIGTSSFSNRVDMQWTGVTDDANGIGLYSTTVSRNGTLIGYATNLNTFSDPTVSPSTTYTYQFTATDFHLNQNTSSFTLTTPASGSIDPRRVGVRPSGSYYGSGSEQVDLMSGNLNYTVPLITAQSRGGWSVPINLTYNSENWRQDSGGIWNLGKDVGYGYGWKLLAGSLTPYYSGYWTLDHYTFTDASGAEYRLNVNTRGVWTSSEGVFFSYDTATQRLYFPDGSFWVFGSWSTANEPDAGSGYPTVIQDSNGNQITISYDGSNGSARIVNVEDVRAVSSGGGRQTYSFTYDGTNHLVGVTNLTAIAAGTTYVENYTLAYSGATTLYSPFSGTSFGTVQMLSSLTANGISLTRTFQTDSTGTLTKVILPYGGYQRWQYSNTAYSGSRTQPEVLNRYVSSDGSTENTWSITRDAGDSSRNIHLYAQITEPGGIGQKKWTFDTTTTSVSVGLLLSREDWQLPGTPVKLLQVDNTWASNQTLASATTTTNPGSSQIVKKLSYFTDSYGNVTQLNVGQFNSTSVLRYYMYGYVTDSNYLSRYITNLNSSTIMSGYTAIPSSPYTHYDYLTLNTNYYDADPSSPCYGSGFGGIGTITGAYEHDDTNYPSAFTYRGNRTSSATPARVGCASYDMLGNSPTHTDAIGRVISVGFGANYAATTSSSMGIYSEAATYNTLLNTTSQSSINGTANFSYDSFDRPLTSTSPTGAVTSYTYTTSPSTVTATINGRWTKTTFDGLGRTMLSEAGNSGGTVSRGETEYYANGQLYRTSSPHAPATSPRWTTYVYDGLGRTLSVTAPDGASTSSYSYLANTTTSTDATGNWKKMITNEFGQITTVTEPNPAGGTWDKNYFYTPVGQLAQVKMTRGGTTQTRSYTYDVIGGRMISSTTPEQGTTTYAYYSDGTPHYKIDAMGQKTEVLYDALGRIRQSYVYDASGTQQTCGAVTYQWDGGYIGGIWTPMGGKLFHKLYKVGIANSCYQIFEERFTYTSNGLMASKTLSSAYGDLTANMTYDNEGRMASLKYPDTTSGTGPTYNYTYNGSLGQIDTMTQTGGGTLVNGVTYGPAGEMLTMSFGGYNEIRQYNVMNQLTRLTDVVASTSATTVDLEYRFSATQNNGKLSQMKDWVSGEEVTYAYDALNRLSSAATTSSAWGQGYVYDGFGNLLQQNVTKGTAPSMSISVNAATNQVAGNTYDANGNDLTSSKTYNLLNQLETAGGKAYYYAPDGKRIRKGYPEEWYFYLGNMKLGTYQYPGYPATSYSVLSTNLYFGGRIISSGGSPVLTDRLGSNITGGRNFFPYGQEKVTTANNVEKFTGYFRDAETGLDYADQRYHDSGNGRFITPDPAGNGLNYYTYAGGDPVNSVDPSGLCAGTTTSGVPYDDGDNSQCSTTVYGNAPNSGLTGCTFCTGGGDEPIVCLGNGCYSLTMACSIDPTLGGGNLGYSCGGPLPSPVASCPPAGCFSPSNGVTTTKPSDTFPALNPLVPGPSIQSITQMTIAGPPQHLCIYGWTWSDKLNACDRDLPDSSQAILQQAGIYLNTFSFGVQVKVATQGLPINPNIGLGLDSNKGPSISQGFGTANINGTGGVAVSTNPVTGSTSSNWVIPIGGSGNGVNITINPWCGYFGTSVGITIPGITFSASQYWNFGC